MRDDSAARKHGPEQVDANGCFPRGPIDVLEPSFGAVDTRVVHEDVDAPERLQRALEDAPDVRGNRDVRRFADDCLAGGRDCELCSRTLHCGSVPAADADPRARGEIRVCNRQAEALARTGDDCGAAVEHAGYENAFPTVTYRTRGS